MTNRKTWEVHWIESFPSVSAHVSPLPVAGDDQEGSRQTDPAHFTH